MADESLEQLIGYHFTNKALLEEALTHPSVTSRNKANDLVNYERLEFLGDAVLGLVVAQLVMETYPAEREGSLAKRLSALVRGESLAQIAITIGIGKYIRMTSGEASMGGRDNPSNIENALEALIGAIYQDGGLQAAQDFIHTHWSSLVNGMLEPPKDPKTTLQEWAQAYALPIPTYDLLEVEGPSHSPIFTIKLEVSGQNPTIAKGETKKKAEKKAAKMMLAQIHASQKDSI